MTVLAVDTSGPVVGVALLIGDRIVYEAVGDLGKTHSQTLMPMLDMLKQATGLILDDVDLFACVAGPGSFTGVRIGVCAVQAMAEATGKPCMALDALEVLAATQYGFEGTICPILDARRGQVYAAAFAWADGVCNRLMADEALPLNCFLGRLPQDGRLLFVGDGVGVHGERVRAALGGQALIAPPHRARLMPSAACALAASKPDGRVDAAQLLPIYLRAPQAEREREEKMNGG